MLRHRRSGRIASILSTTNALLVVSLLLSACASKTGRTFSGTLLGFNESAAEAANQVIPPIKVALVCGSDTAAFGTELTQVSDPALAKVPFEWGEIVPNHNMFMAGTITHFEFSRGDLTFTHPFGLDVVFDVKPDAPYAELAQKLGEGDDNDGPPPGTVHTELEKGLFPHQGTEYLPGFIPRKGDRVLALGHWVIDCGHDDYHTEMHPPAFLAFARTEANTTVSRAFYNPYYESQLFNPDPSLASQVTNQKRFTDARTMRFPGYLRAELLRVGHITEPHHDQLEAHHLMSSFTQSPLPWYVCAPEGGGKLTYSYRFTVRPGVSIQVTPFESTGCIRVRATIGPTYTPFQLTRKDCVDKWSELNAQAQAALGSPDIDVRKLIEEKVPKSLIPAIERDPVVDCYDSLQAPSPGGGGAPVVTSPSQAFPFYGVVQVSRG